MVILTGLVLTLGFFASSQSELVLDALKFPTPESAQKVWSPSAGGLPVQTRAVGSRSGLQLPFDLTGNQPRAYWDRELSVDLSRSDRFSFWFYLDDPAKASPTWNLYFRSGKGWYGSTFAVEKGWNHVKLSKSQFTTEETPAGWKQIDGVRIGVWKAQSAATFAMIDDLRAHSSSVAVISGKGAESEAKTFDLVLGGIGLDFGGLDESDIESGALAGRAVAIFPNNPDLTEKQVDKVIEFIQAGGKVMVCYVAPPRLLSAIGVKQVTWKRQDFPGQFAQIDLAQAALQGLPQSVKQASWNTNVVLPEGHDAKTIGDWKSLDGKPADVPALILSKEGAYLSHVLLGDDVAGKQQLMLALLGNFSPSVWPTAASRALETAGTIGTYRSLAEANEAMRASSRPGVKGALDNANNLYRQAQTAAAKKEYATAVKLATQAHSAFVDTYCLSQAPKTGEVRAVWCHAADGIEGRSWEESMKGLEDNGFTMVAPNMLWGGRAYYPSKVLPVDESVATKGDQIALCLAAAKRHNMQVHVWKVNWNLLNAPKSFLSQMRSEGRTQKDPNGKDIDWLCPSHPLNFELERESMLEVARNYAVDGLHFDYIRYPGSDGCYCEGCHKRFEAEYQVQVKEWPADVLRGEHRAKFLTFRQANITRLVKAVSEQARKIRPGISISAAVFPDWPQCKETIGQDWVTWVKQGYVDFVCPMNYTKSTTQYGVWMDSQTQALGGSKAYVPGLGADLGTVMSSDQVVSQILLTRKANSKGFILFNLSEALLRDVLPSLRLGVSAKK